MSVVGKEGLPSRQLKWSFKCTVNIYHFECLPLLHFSHREGWRHSQGSHSFQTLIFKNKTTFKYITYLQKSNEAGLDFNLPNQSTDAKGLCHVAFPQSVFYSNGYHTTDKNYISFSYLSGFMPFSCVFLILGCPSHPTPFYSTF